MRFTQRLANLFVDEARLSSNQFHLAQDEYKALIENYDAKIVEDDHYESDLEALVSGEMYLF